MKNTFKLFIARLDWELLFIYFALSCIVGVGFIVFHYGNDFGIAIVVLGVWTLRGTWDKMTDKYYRVKTLQGF